MKSLLFVLLFGGVAFTSSFAQSTLYFPPSGSGEWAVTSPDDLGWCQDSIDALLAYLEVEQTKSFLVLKDGRIVLEHYFGTFTQDSLWLWFSAGKSLRAVLVGIAQQEGMLSINDRSSDYLGEGWSSLSAEQENAVTVWHQLTMTSGLDERIFTCTSPACLRYVADAGTRWAYHNSPYNLTKNVLETATGASINQYTNQKVKAAIGMSSGIWIPSGDNTFFASRARDMARFGLLIQNQGVWNQTPVLTDTAYVQQMLNTSQPLNPSYGYLWWLNGKASYIGPNSPESFPGAFSPNAPSDVVTAAGAQGQLISISPSLGLVVVRQGTSDDEDLAALELHDKIWARLMALACVTATDEAEEANGLALFPNPVKAGGLLQINGLESDGQSVYITNMGGQFCGSRPMNGGAISTQGLAPGMYMLSINTGNSVRMGRFVVL